MILLETTDFDSGEYVIAQTNDTTALIQTYIDRHEAAYIKRILGVELGLLFIEDIQGNDADSDEITARMAAIRDAFMIQADSGCIYESKGMKDILMAIVFYFFVSETQVKHSQSGVITNAAEVSNIAQPENATRFAETKFNGALSSIEAIQWYCGTEETATYPEYDGTYIRPRYSNLL